MAKVNLDSAARLDIVCRKGDSFDLTVEFDATVPAHDGAGITYLMEVRKNDTTSDLTQGTFTITRDAGNSKKLNIKNGAVTMASINSGLYVYDLQVKDDNVSPYTVKTYLFGTFEVTEDIAITT